MKIFFLGTLAIPYTIGARAPVSVADGGDHITASKVFDLVQERARSYYREHVAFTSEAHFKSLQELKSAIHSKEHLNGETHHTLQNISSADGFMISTMYGQVFSAYKLGSCYTNIGYSYSYRADLSNGTAAAKFYGDYFVTNNCKGAVVYTFPMSCMPNMLDCYQYSLTAPAAPPRTYVKTYFSNSSMPCNSELLYLSYQDSSGIFSCTPKENSPTKYEKVECVGTSAVSTVFFDSNCSYAIGPATVDAACSSYCVPPFFNYTSALPVKPAAYLLQTACPPHELMMGLATPLGTCFITEGVSYSFALFANGSNPNSVTASYWWSSSNCEGSPSATGMKLYGDLNTTCAADSFLKSSIVSSLPEPVEGTWRKKFFKDSSCSIATENTVGFEYGASSLCYDTFKMSCVNNVAIQTIYSGEDCTGASSSTPAATCIPATSAGDTQYGAYYSAICKPANATGIPTAPTAFLNMKDCDSPRAVYVPIGGCYSIPTGSSLYATAVATGTQIKINAALYSSDDCSLSPFASSSYSAVGSCLAGSLFSAAVASFPLGDIVFSFDFDITSSASDFLPELFSSLFSSTLPPSKTPLKKSSTAPSKRPSGRPSPPVKKSNMPSKRPSAVPSKRPSGRPSPPVKRSNMPSKRPSVVPSKRPSGRPSKRPSGRPSKCPSSRPVKKTNLPTKRTI